MQFCGAGGDLGWLFNPPSLKNLTPEMPEGPEVALVTDGLQHLVGTRIKGLLVASHREYSQRGLGTFDKLLGSKITSIERRGKWILWTFENLMGAMNHLGMSGSWWVKQLSTGSVGSFACFDKNIELDFKALACFDTEQRLEVIAPFLDHLSPGLHGILSSATQKIASENKDAKKNPDNLVREENMRKASAGVGVGSTSKFIRGDPIKNVSDPKHAINDASSAIVDQHAKLVIFSGSSTIAVFRDVRTFGCFRVYDKASDMFRAKAVAKLGPDILDSKFDVEEFTRRLREHPRSAIGSLLLDGAIVAGCGNIYRAESLFEAEISPFRPVSSLDDSEIARIAAELHSVAMKAYEAGGSTLQDYRNVSGDSGGMQTKFMIYGRAGKGCFRCGAVIVADKQSNRTTYWCKGCQE